MEIEPSWALRSLDDAAAVARLGKALNDLPEALARALLLRGIDTFESARTFFRSGTESLHDPFGMADMPEAARRLADAIRNRQRVVVFGDYDVDGTTSTALLTDFLRRRDVLVTPFVPDRFRHGYGLSRSGIDDAVRQGADLVVALDCGVTALEEAQYVASLGIDLIIADHHLPLETLPLAVAVIDAKRNDCQYPFDGLCACGVAFKLVSATLVELGEDPGEAEQYLDLVALATAADIVPLVGENRILLRAGLERIRNGARPGILSLARAASLNLADCDTRSIGFSIGPRINAAGRIDDANLAVALLLATDPAEADRLADRLEVINGKRRELDQRVAIEASAQAGALLESEAVTAFVLHNPSWHLGILGIVASRIADQFGRPAILLTTVGELVKGSARSVPGVPVYDAVHACRDLLTAYGGHDYAAGLTLRSEDLDAFRDRFGAAVRASSKAGSMGRVVELDAELDLSVIDTRFRAVLRQFEPHGCDNEAPLFHARRLEVVGMPSVIGKDRSHLRFSVRQAGTTAPPVPVIAFRQGHRLPLVADRSRPIELACRVQDNVWNGVASLQLQAEEIRQTPNEG